MNLFKRRPSIVNARISIIGLAALAAAAAGIAAPSAPEREAAVKPTVVLVHGAFAESASWSAITAKLLSRGYPVVAVANPLRSLGGDAAYVARVLDAVTGPVILVGHSYGGAVITNAATGNAKVKALVYVAAFAPEAGESASFLSEQFPGSTLAAALAPPVALADGGQDLYVRQDLFHAQFAADVPYRAAKAMAATQRPITLAALAEPSASAAWKTIPAWFIYGTLDKNIPPAAIEYMARRAGARRIVAIKGASHVVMISHPDALLRLINEAAAAPAPGV